MTTIMRTMGMKMKQKTMKRKRKMSMNKMISMRKISRNR